MEMENFWRKKVTFIWQKVDIYFEMVHSNLAPMVPKEKGLVTR